MIVFSILQYSFNMIIILVFHKQIKNIIPLVVLLSLNTIISATLYSTLDIFTVFYSLLSTNVIFWLTKQDRILFSYTIPIGFIISIVGDYLSNFILLLLGLNISVGNDLDNISVHLILSFLVSLLLAIVGRKTIFAAKITKQGWVVSLFSYFLLNTYYLVIIFSRLSGNNQTIFMINTIFFAIYFAIIVISLFILSKTFEKRLTDDLRQRELELQKDYISKIEKNYFELSTVKHNYKNILFSLKLYIDEENLAGLKKYYYNNILPTGKLDMSQVIDFNQLRLIKNDTLRSFFSVKLMEAVNKSIHFHLELEQDFEVPEEYLYVLIEALGIILDNALEELIETQNYKPLEIKFECLKHSKMITVINPTSSKPPLHQLKQKGFSTKKDGANGHGLAILDELIKKEENLSLHTKISSGHFSQRIFIEEE